MEQRFGVVGCRSDGTTLRSVMVTGPWLDRSPGVEQAGALGVFLEQWPRIADFDEDANHPASTTDSLDAALNRNRGIAP